MKNIVLIGMMGCGKTTVSKELAKSLKRPVIDIDDYLEEKYQMSISQMFDISEDYFREREHICCQDVAVLDGYIVSTGGGVIKNIKNIEVLKKNGIIFYLDRPVEMIFKDIDISQRPLLKDGPSKLYELYQQRHQLYLDACDYHVYNDSSLEDIVMKIKNIVENK